MYRCRLAALAVVFWAMLAAGASAQTCSGNVSNINFGSISVRSGAVNQTSGTLRVTCSGALVSPVGVCVYFGAGSGGAGGGNSPRYMRASDNSSLSYQLRSGGNGAGFGTLNSVFLSVPVVLGSGSATVPIYADILSDSVSVKTGNYQSVFSGSSDISLSYGLVSCELLGTKAPIPDFSVSADVVASCEVDAEAMAFGTLVGENATTLDARAIVNVRCTETTPFSLGLGLGTGPGVTDPANRLMSSGIKVLRYGLYHDAARSAVWGDQAQNDRDSVGTGFNQSFDVFGRIHSGQSMTYGVYADSVLVTVTY